MSKIDDIRDTSQLQDFLSSQKKHLTITRETGANDDYTGTLKNKKKAPINLAVSDRYSKPSITPRSSISKRVHSINVSAEKATETIRKEQDDLETRSVCQEIDYSKKDAARNLFNESQDGRKNRLRDRVLRNIEGVKSGKAVLMSDIASSIRSVGLRSRA